MNALLHVGKIITVNLLILAVLVAGIEFYFYRNHFRGAFVVAHPYLNHTWPANDSWQHREFINKNPEFPTPYTTRYNSQSWVETYDVQRKKAKNTFRIFYVGDSFTEGTVHMDGSVPSLVETELNRRFGTDRLRFEVINTGTSSYSPVLYFILITRYLVQYDPDLIVVNVDMTDDFDDFKYRETLIVDSAGNPVAAPPRDIVDAAYIDTKAGPVAMTPRRKLWMWMYLHSYTFQHIVRQRAPVPADRIAVSPDTYPRWAWVRHDWDDRTTSQVEFSMDVLARIADVCQARDIQLLMTGVPHFDQLAVGADGSPRWSRRPHDELENLARRKGVHYFSSLDFMAGFVNSRNRDAYYYRGDMHFNPNGYALWAKAHVSAITDPRMGILPEGAWRNNVP